MRRRVALVVIIVVTIVSGALGALIGYSVAGSSTSSKRSSPTKVTVFGIPVGMTPKGFSRVDGSCELGSSESSNRPDSARCFTSTDAVLDPCFHSEAGSTAGELELFVCPGDPWNAKLVGAVVVTEGDAGEVGEPPSSFRPWALLLANGQRCIAITGASGTTAGLRHNYQCFAPPFARSARQAIGKEGGIVLGDPDQRAPTWKVLFGKNTAGAGFTPVAVREAYE